MKLLQLRRELDERTAGDRDKEESKKAKKLNGAE